MIPSNNLSKPSQPGPIGVFDSGYGGLTILKSLRAQLPQYDYIYLGDNARAPYGTRSFELVYDFTLQAVKHLFAQGCHLVILACNTASAKALRSIQQRDLPVLDPTRRVLGVIRPTVEQLGATSRSGHVGVLGTPGTVASGSYNIEIEHLNPGFVTTAHACPMWVPLVEYGEAASPGADYFVRKEIDALLAADPLIDTIVLGCTHYPLLMPKIVKYVNPGIRIVPQGEYVAESLRDYFLRHPEMEEKCTKNGKVHYLTTENPDKFKESAQIFLHEDVEVKNIVLG